MWSAGTIVMPFIESSGYVVHWHAVLGFVNKFPQTLRSPRFFLSFGVLYTFYSIEKKNNYQNHKLFIVQQ